MPPPDRSRERWGFRPWLRYEASEPVLDTRSARSFDARLLELKSRVTPVVEEEELRRGRVGVDSIEQ